MQRLEIRARQIRALYQRELTALHRRPLIEPDEKQEQALRLWRQATNQLDALRAQAEARARTLTPEQEILFAPPPLPPELATLLPEPSS